MKLPIVDKLKSRRRPAVDVSHDLDLIAFVNEARTDAQLRSAARMARARSRAAR